MSDSQALDDSPLSTRNGKFEESENRSSRISEDPEIAGNPHILKRAVGEAPAGFASQEIKWDGPNDQLNPMNWPPGQKWKTLGVISLMTFITFVTLASTWLNC